MALDMQMGGVTQEGSNQHHDRVASFRSESPGRHGPPEGLWAFMGLNSASFIAMDPQNQQNAYGIDLLKQYSNSATPL